jgi:hypothetical protein
MEPDEFARRALRLVAENRSTIVVPGWWRVITWLSGAATPLLERGIAIAMKRTMARVIRPSAQAAPRTATEARVARDFRAGS